MVITGTMEEPYSVADPGVQISWGGGSTKNLFFRGEGRATRAPPLNPPQLLTDTRDNSRCGNGLEGRRKTHSWLVFFFSCSRYSNRHRGLETASLNVSKQALMENKNTHRGNEYRSENQKFFAQLSIQKDLSRCD